MATKHQPGDIYKESGIINYPKLFVAFFISLLLSGSLGIGYGFLSQLNPLIYLNVLFLIATYFLSGFMIQVSLNYAKPRSQFVKLIFSVISILFLIYNAWISNIYSESTHYNVWDGLLFTVPINEIFEHIRQLNISISSLGINSSIIIGSTILAFIYTIEALILIVGPLNKILAYNTYFCETCQKPLSSKDIMFTHTTEDYTNFMNGDLSNLTLESKISTGEFSQLKNKAQLKVVSLHHCDTCNKAIVDIKNGEISRYNQSNRLELKKTIVSGLFIDDASTSILLSN